MAINAIGPHSKEAASTNRKRIAVFAIVIAFISALSITGFAIFRGISITDLGASSDVSTPHNASEAWEGQPPAARIITLTPRGFEPREINVKAGKLLLAINNRAGVSEMSVEISRRIEEGDGRSRTEIIPIRKDINDPSPTEQRVRVAKETLNWRDIVDFASGQYVVKHTDRPEWTCTINVN